MINITSYESISKSTNSYPILYYCSLIKHPHNTIPLIFPQYLLIYEIYLLQSFWTIEPPRLCYNLILAIEVVDTMEDESIFWLGHLITDRKEPLSYLPKQEVGNEAYWLLIGCTFIGSERFWEDEKFNGIHPFVFIQCVKTPEFSCQKKKWSWHNRRPLVSIQSSLKLATLLSFWLGPWLFLPFSVGKAFILCFQLPSTPPSSSLLYFLWNADGIWPHSGKHVILIATISSKHFKDLMHRIN